MSRANQKTCLLYENAEGNIPKDLRKMCHNMADLFDNFSPSTRSKPILSAEDYGALRKAIDRASKIELRKLCHTKKFVDKGIDLYLLKVKTQSNPRLYFTDVLPDHLVFLYGLKKKKFEEDPGDESQGRERLESIRSGDVMSRF